MTERDPKTGRFSAGFSGNPLGRATGSQNYETLLANIMMEPHEVKRDGKYLEVTTLSLVLEKVKQMAMTGNPSDVSLFQKWDTYLNGSQMNDQRAGYLVVPEPFETIEEWMREAELVLQNIPKHAVYEEEDDYQN